jgi:hypothetical protein
MREADEVAAWGAPGQTLDFRMNRERLVIIRVRADGPDGGWRYPYLGAMLLDWSEIAGLAMKLHGERWARKNGGVHAADA